MNKMAENSTTQVADNVSVVSVSKPTVPSAQPSDTPQPAVNTKADVDGETVLASDAALPINDGAADSPQLDPESTPAAQEAVVVTEDDVEANDSSSRIDKMAEEIENLTGEIQALEAKIEQIAQHSRSLPSAESVDKTPVVGKQETVLPAPVPSSAVDRPITAKDLFSSSAAISPKKPFNGPRPGEAMDLTDEQQNEHPSVLALIGEVIAIIGIILFVVMLSAPLYKEAMGSDLWDAVKSVGWLTAIGTTAIGLLLSLFGKGKIFLKILILLFLLGSIVMYMGTSGMQSFLGPLGPALKQLFGFYQ